MAQPSSIATSNGAPRAGGVNPLVRALTLDQVQRRDEELKPPVAEIVIEGPPESALAGHVRLAWQRNKIAKERIDQKLLQCLRARRGVYSAAEIAAMQANNGGVNAVFTDLTETKCRAASAWIREIVLPVGEQPWGVEPTPMPDLPMPIKTAVVQRALAQAEQAMQEAAQSGGGVMPPDEYRDLVLELGEKLRGDAEKAYCKAAEKRAKRMEKQIADRMAQGNYQAAIDGFIEDFVTYPAALLKGPFYKRQRQLQWGSDFKPKVSNPAVPWWDRVSPFDAYPAPSSTSPQQGDFIERVRFRRSELHDLKGLPGYKDDQIDKALMDYSGGRLEGWLWTESERQRLEQETLFMWLTPEGVIDAINYWGSVPGWKLITWGVEGIEDETRDYECNVLLCGSYVLYATLNPDPLMQRPYRKACYDEIPGAFWGRSIPDLAGTSQKMCNFLGSAFADNLGIASGPQVWVHADRFADGEQSMELFPWKIWQLKSDPQAAGAAAPGIGFFQPDDRSGPLMMAYEKWELKADDATGIPRYTYGNERAGGSADTASGLSMLMTNAAKGLRRAISNIDLNVISPTVNDTFTNEMLYNPDPSMKGDCVIVPRGAAAILIREAAQQRRIQFLGLTGNPIDSELIGGKYRLALLRETAAALELPVDDVVPSDEDYEAQQQAQAQAMQQAQQQQLEMQMADKKADQQFELQKETLIAQREKESKSADVLADVIKQAVGSAMQEQQAKQPRKVRFTHDEEGQIVGAEAD